MEFSTSLRQRQPWPRSSNPRRRWRVNPLKVSQPVRASLAFSAGPQPAVDARLPGLHGLGKVFFVRHFREPILQTTAMDQVSTIMGSRRKRHRGTAYAFRQEQAGHHRSGHHGASETQGTDIKRAVKDFRVAHPEFAGVAVVPVNTPDYVGCLESGYALAIEALIDTLTGKRGDRQAARR